MSSEPNLPALNPVSSASLTLEPPYLNQGVLNVLGAEVGGGIRHTENFMYVNIPRWSVVEAFDIYEFYMGDPRFPMASASVLPGHEYRPYYELAIAQEHVPEGFSFPCFSVVRRSGSGTSEGSAEVTWFIKVNRPGGSDMGHEMFHPALKLSLPPDLAAPGAILDPDRAALGVLCTIEPYPNMRVRDTVEGFWDGRVVNLRLDDDHVSGAKPIEIFFPPEIVLMSASGNVTIRFGLFDEVLNRSGPDRRWSQAVHLESDLQAGLLSRPYFLHDRKDIFDVNFDTQGSGRFEVEVVTPRNLPDGRTTPPGTQIIVKLSGVRADGTLLELRLPAFAALIERSAYTDVSSAVLKELINGTLRVSHELQFPLGTVLASSRRVTVTIFGVVSVMPPVTIVQNEGGLIDPEALFITVQFPDYVPYGRDYNVTLRLEAIAAGGGVVSFEQTRLAGDPPPQPRTILREDFEPFIGLGNVKVFYRVDDGEIEVTDVGTLAVRESEPLTVSFGERVPQLPPAEIDPVDENGNIDPDTVFGSVKVTLPYSQTIPGDKVTWSWTGTGGPGGSTAGSFTLNGGTAGRPLIYDVDKTFVENNNDGEIRLRYYLERDDSATLYSHELVVSVGKAMGTLVAPEVLEATKNPDQLAPEEAVEGATIRVAFEEMVPADRIRVEWRGVVDIGTYDDTKNGDVSKTLDFTVPAEVIGANIAPSGRNIEVQFFLLRGSREIPSQVLDLRLLTLTVKPVPLIDGIGNVPILELFNLVNTARTRTAPWLFSHREQRVWMEYRGVFADGNLFSDRTYTADRLGEVVGLSPPAPVDKLKALRDDSILTITVRASFDRSFNEGNAVTMEVKEYLVQALPGTLPHPTLVGADGVGSVISVDPLSIEHNREVKVSYAPMNPTDMITLQWVQQDGVTPYIAPKNGLVGGTVVFPISTEVLARSVKSQVQSRYSIVRNNTTIESYIQTVNVGTISSAHLPAPTLNGFAGGVLDLVQFTGNALAGISKWPLSAAGTYAQRVWLICTSEDAEPLYVLSNHVLTAAEQANGLLNVPVSRLWLQALKYNSAVTLTCKVTYNGSALESAAITFPVAHFTVRPGLLDETNDFNSYDLQGWSAIHPSVAISVAHSGSEFYIFTDHNAYMGCQKRFANAGPGDYEVTIRYRVSAPSSRNYVYANVSSV
ncbi:hypothetical protein [Pseudomonas sp. W4I3]|uniref:hypothetical protein n=1 Tax=Pseudomonas sp. W4I3 TaxID=3042294 RepID=UPI002785CEF5|nr:hypothetical protein [Pseudomonas sp. W4I3]MDQ0740862.1 hypothetical protein [Pseudomonas sp. W4I3]